MPIQILSKMPELTIPPLLKWVGGVAAALTAALTAWVQFGGAVPLTKNSTVLKEMVQFERIQELDIDILEVKQRQIRVKQLLDSVDSTNFILTQFEGRTNLTDGERYIKVSLEGDVQEYLRELKEMARGE